MKIRFMRRKPEVYFIGVIEANSVFELSLPNGTFMRIPNNTNQLQKVVISEIVNKRKWWKFWKQS